MSFLSKTKIRTKFLIPPLIFLLLLAIATPFFLKSVDAQYNKITSFAKDDLTNSQELFLLFGEVSMNHTKITRFLDNDQSQQPPENIKKTIETFKRNILRFLHLFAQITQKYYVSTEHQSLINKMNGAFINYKTSMFELLDQAQTDHKLARQKLKETNKVYMVLNQGMDKLSGKITAKTQQAIKELQKSARQQVTIFVGILSAIIIVSMLSSLVFSSYLSKPIVNLANTIKMITKTGNFSFRAIKDTEGEIGDLIDGFNQMLFEMQRSDEFAKHTREYTQNIIQSMSPMLLVTNAKGLIKTVNKSALQELGYIKKDMSDLFIEYVLHQSEGNKMTPVALNELITKDYSTPTEKIFVGKDGKQVRTTFSSTVMRDSDDRVQGIVCVAYPCV